MNPETPEQIGLNDFLTKLPIETEYGRMEKEMLQPVGQENREILERSYQEIEKMMEERTHHPGLIKELRKLIHGQKNIRKSMRNAMDQQVLSDVELFEIKIQAFAMERLNRYLERHKAVLFPSITLYPVKWLIELLDPEATGIETFYIYDAYDPKLKALRSRKEKIKEQILVEEKQQEKQIVERLALKPLWNKEIHIPKEQPEKQETLQRMGTYVKANETKSHWIYGPVKHEMEESYSDLLGEEEVLEQKIRSRLSRCIGEKAFELIQNTEALGYLDILLGKVSLAIKYQCCKPEILEKPWLRVSGGRHPGLEEKLRKEGLHYTPVDIQASRGVTLITGANMGGKTMSLKMMALMVSLAQLGFWVPAEAFSFQPIEFLYFSTGDQQSQDLGLSTFGAEVHGLNKALKMAGRNGLILLDELASGTNPKEGYGISKAIVHHLSQQRAISVVTTHYDGIGDLDGIRHLQVVGLRDGLQEQMKNELEKAKNPAGVFEKYMDYRLKPKDRKDPVPRDAIRVAELMGLPENILKQARGYLGEESREKED